MVNAKTVVERYKLARKGPPINWVPYVKDDVKNNRVAIVGNDGEWIFNALKKNDDAKWKIQITVPSGSKDPKPGTYEWPSGYRAEKLDDAKKELGLWIDDLRKNGTLTLTGWRKT